MKKNIFTIIGFLLFLFGLSALVLSLVGVKLSFLLFIDKGGAGLGFVIRLLMTFGGIVIAWVSKTNWESENEEKDQYITRNEKY
jgi:uncharacterized membrane protein